LGPIYFLFSLVKNHKTPNNAASAEAREKVISNLEYLELFDAGSAIS